MSMLSVLRRFKDASATSLTCSGRLFIPCHLGLPSGLRLKPNLVAITTFSRIGESTSLVSWPRGSNEIDGDVRGSGVFAISRNGPARCCGDAPLGVCCDGVHDAGTENAIGSNKQDLTLRELCFNAGGHFNSPLFV